MTVGYGLGDGKIAIGVRNKDSIGRLYAIPSAKSAKNVIFPKSGEGVQNHLGSCGKLQGSNQMELRYS